MMTSQELREKFIKYFESKGHKLLPPSSLVSDDPTTLFTTAGMQQFKKYYLDPSDAPAKNIVTVQPCFRTSDIEEVGDDTHLTFFEMLGNFSFNSYGKEEAIKYAWEFLTDELRIDKKRISATYFDTSKAEINIDVETDTESLAILQKVSGLEKIIPQGDDNYWSLGTIGSPGGPTVEFYVDDIEVWNLVFNQWIKIDGGWKKSETLGVDTGMGLERLLTILNNKNNVYETDLFEVIIKKIEGVSGLKFGDKTDEEHRIEDGQCWVDTRRKFKIIADHIKASVFAVNDGILPSNKDAGYIVRRLIRRAIVNANQIDITKNFVSDIIEVVFNVYKDVYDFNIDTITSELTKEEDKFRKTLTQGLNKIKANNELSGQDLFDLYQSYGLPIEISIEEAKNKNIKISHEAMEQFNNSVLEHQDLSRTASAGMFKGGLASGGEQEIKYHTATHLLHSALRKVLGEEVEQRGSNINAERMRFDFSFPDKLTQEQIKEVESLVNENIKKDLEVNMEEMSLEDAQNCGAIGLFESKYGDKVKVYTIGSDSSTPFGRSEPPVSREICGGPHVKLTGVLGHFKITKEESSSAGIRRIKAVLE